MSALSIAALTYEQGKALRLLQVQGWMRTGDHHTRHAAAELYSRLGHTMYSRWRIPYAHAGCPSCGEPGTWHLLGCPPVPPSHGP